MVPGRGFVWLGSVTLNLAWGQRTTTVSYTSGHWPISLVRLSVSSRSARSTLTRRAVPRLRILPSWTQRRIVLAVMGVPVQVT